MNRFVAALAMALVGATVCLPASDRVGVYAIVDKVVFEPNAANPERIQIWGAFAVATRTDRDFYEPVQHGYLYFATGTATQLTRAEWNDLSAMAGSKKIVAFGSRLGQSARVRHERETPVAPDRYVMGIGVQIIRPDRDYPPIKGLAALIAP
jgi:hypothetical protein